MNLKNPMFKSLKPLGAAALALTLVGCASSGVRNPSGVPVTEMRPDERGFVAGTGVESQDVVTISDKISRMILNTPEIAQAQGVPRIVLLPIENNTRFAFNKNIFLSKIQDQLTQSTTKVRFLARERIQALEQERQLKQSGQVTSSSDPNVQEFKGADFFLTGKLEGLSTRTSQGMSDYILYTFQLIDPRTSDIIFSGSHEIKRQGLEDASYR
jgi:PBP1b-binding outer membrane lipoprotein LpoB